MNHHEIHKRLGEKIRAADYLGYDPYDALNTSFTFLKKYKWPRIILIQALKRLPLNLRPVLGINKGLNPKTLGLMLQAYSLEGKEAEAKNVFQRLLNCTSDGYSGSCWGYNFDWASPQKLLKAGSPTVVVTGFIAKGIFAYYKKYKDPTALETLKSIAEFIEKDLPNTKNERGLCISYSTLRKDICFNASLLGGEVFAQLFELTQDAHYTEKAKSIVDFVVSYQHENGSWDYSIAENGVARKQIDFHQGYILESIYNISVSLNLKTHYIVVLKKGMTYYATQFAETGRSYFRIPKKWPADIHHQAQGIITFSLIGNSNKKYDRVASSIMNYTISSFWNEGKSYFYFRQHRVFKNKIDYMRWSQAWMYLAIVRYKQIEEHDFR